MNRGRLVFLYFFLLLHVSMPRTGKPEIGVYVPSWRTGFSHRLIRRTRHPSLISLGFSAGSYLRLSASIHRLQTPTRQCTPRAVCSQTCTPS